MGEREEARPVQHQAGHEPSAATASSSLEVYDAEAGWCIVCGRADDNLSTLGRCLGCIRAATVAYHAQLEAARAPAPSRDLLPDDGRPRWARVLLDRREPSAPASEPPAHPTATGSLQARLNGLLRTVAAAPQGRRNDTLHWGACRVGEMLAAGELKHPGSAADALTAVALRTGLPPAEVAATVRSGFDRYGVVM